MSVVRSVLRACYGFVIGDDWKVIAAVLTALGSGLLLLVAGVAAAVVAVTTGLLIGVLFAVAVIIDGHRSLRRRPGPDPVGYLDSPGHGR